MLSVLPIAISFKFIILELAIQKSIGIYFLSNLMTVKSRQHN